MRPRPARRYQRLRLPDHPAAPPGPEARPARPSQTTGTGGARPDDNLDRLRHRSLERVAIALSRGLLRVLKLVELLPECGAFILWHDDEFAQPRMVLIERE